MKYLIALFTTIVIYKLTYKWLTNNKWFNSQFEKGDNKNGKNGFQATNQNPDEAEKGECSKARS